MASKSVPGFAGHAFSNFSQPFMLFPFLDGRFGFNPQISATSNNSLSGNNITLSSSGSAYPRISDANGTSGLTSAGFSSETRPNVENVNSLGSVNGSIGPLNMKRNTQVDNLLHNSVSNLFLSLH